MPFFKKKILFLFAAISPLYIRNRAIICQNKRFDLFKAASVLWLKQTPKMSLRKLFERKWHNAYYWCCCLCVRLILARTMRKGKPFFQMAPSTQIWLGQENENWGSSFVVFGVCTANKKYIDQRCSRNVVVVIAYCYSIKAYIFEVFIITCLKQINKFVEGKTPKRLYLFVYQFKGNDFK